MSNALSRLDALHAAHDGAIPAHLLAIARLGSPEAVALMAAEGNAAFYREMVRGQVRTIRARREDGSFYPALLSDLAYYRDHYRAHRRLARELRRIVGSALPSTTAA